MTTTMVKNIRLAIKGINSGFCCPPVQGEVLITFLVAGQCDNT